MIMADREFRVEEDIALAGATLVTPASLRERQLSQRETEHSRNVSNVRIHVERVIGCLRQRFAILNGPVDIRFLYGQNKESQVLFPRNKELNRTLHPSHIGFQLTNSLRLPFNSPPEE